MGHIISADAVCPDSEKLNSIIDMKEPTNATEVRSFLGLVTYCGKFIPNLSAISYPLRKLTQKRGRFYLGKGTRREFQEPEEHDLDGSCSGNL